MSLYGEALINRLPIHSVLHNSKNPMNKILNNTIGEYEDNYDIVEWMLQHFLNDATGKYLDLHGSELGVRRLKDETDDKYRQRLIYKAKGHLSLDYLMTMYDIEVYTGTDSYTANQTLLADNPYLSHDGLYIKCDTATQNELEKKLVLGGEVTWL